MDHATVVKIFYILGNKAEKVAQESGYSDQDFETPEYRKFEKAWDSYLGKLGIERVGKSDNVRADDDRVWVPDPLDHEGEWVLMPQEIADMILMLGLP